MDMKRESRKHDHIKLALGQKDGPQKAGWEDIKLIHQAIANTNLANIDTSQELFGKTLKLPLIINALTGGAEGLDQINGALARAANQNGIGLAVGSQTAAIRNRALKYTFNIVRKYNPHGLVMANVSALVKPAYAREAVEMLEADVLQLHLNPVQELVMEEGDRDFTDILDNIHEIVHQIKIPVIVKEVGFGISRESALKLCQTGIKAIDTNGAGGTNFARIELGRMPRKHLEALQSWGIPSAISLLEVMDLKLPITIIASGGIRTASHMIKALALGADMVGIAGPMLRTLLNEGEEALNKYIEDIQEEMKIEMMLLGAKKLNDIKKIPLIITGEVKEWCQQRNIDLQEYAVRRI